ncbi:MAG: hypothetical protein RLZZ301_309 [Bacteroidota bacterium]|jgi:uracil-DNA glycosylase
MDVHIEAGWKSVLAEEFAAPFFAELTQKVKQAYAAGPVYPKKSELFAAFDQCPFAQVKVVILGQDPYPTKGHAHGLCFSVNPEVRPLPKSLQNIFKELQSDLQIPAPETGDLRHWANQGVLLLNTYLSVEEGKPESHKHLGWERFTDAVISKVSTQKEALVFILWGSKAHAKEALIDPTKHLILKAVHPSPLSAHRGFFGCRHFSLANAYLKANGLKEIHWDSLPL